MVDSCAAPSSAVAPSPVSHLPGIKEEFCNHIDQTYKYITINGDDIDMCNEPTTSTDRTCLRVEGL
ncbi:uncharacterized protein PHALS_09784 [Plasmopara halstedii]|uniref:Uncharacterized protein n=1 Tax=Plasmopara halstedii TaxID=4781 RepID=A0A0P1AES2_PLAHL|nr:uncharacterized protein PHALS_09784 [Plasmopara halstedii]CEG39542.1 hypothetical protein PHALS_09784 [Plasmopara halstedii]|eukprot:XP_024575911.1 hypothetical protein PHALS_09784 [Plasmopara halstedii]